MNVLFLPIEIKTREFLPKLFLISRALKKNVDCFIGDKVAVNRAVRYFKKGIYFHKSINKNDKDYILDMKSKVDTYISLDEEFGFATTNKKQFKNYLDIRSSYENVKNVDRVYNWGNFDRSVWTKRYSSFANKFLISGAPRLDIWRKNIYSSIFKSEISSLKKKYKKFIFIPSTFISSKNKLNKFLKVEKKILKKKNFLTKSMNSKIFEYNLFREFLKLSKLLSKDFPDLNIVIKPHPTEDPKDWIKNTQKYENIHIDNQHELTPYLAAAELIIFNSSTSGIQSILMNKKTICYSVSKEKDSLRSFPNKFGVNCKNYKRLKKIIKVYKKNNFKKNLKQIKKRIFISKKYSSDIILDDLINNFGLKKNNIIKKNLILFRINSILFKIDHFLNSIFNHRTNNKKEVNQPLQPMKLKLGTGINKNEIISFFKKFQFMNYKILSYGRNGYLIYK